MLIKMLGCANEAFVVMDVHTRKCDRRGNSALLNTHTGRRSCGSGCVKCQKSHFCLFVYLFFVFNVE